MAVGAFDYLDQLLVEKYSNSRVDNHEVIESVVSPNKMLSSMNEFSSMSKNMFTLNQQLTAACSALNSINAQYKKAVTMEDLYDMECGSIPA